MAPAYTPKTDKGKAQQAEWMKSHTKMYGVRLQLSTDADLIQFIESQPGSKANVFKTALREYIQNHNK